MQKLIQNMTKYDSPSALREFLTGVDGDQAEDNKWASDNANVVKSSAVGISDATMSENITGQTQPMTKLKDKFIERFGPTHLHAQHAQLTDIHLPPKCASSFY